MRTLKPDSEVSRQCLAQRRAKAAGICTRCFKPSRPGKRYCAACAAKAYGELLRDYSRAGETVCDPFMGMATTGIGCIRTGRKFIGIERDPQTFADACERIARELQQQTFDL